MQILGSQRLGARTEERANEPFSFDRNCSDQPQTSSHNTSRQRDTNTPLSSAAASDRLSSESGRGAYTLNKFAVSRICLATVCVSGNECSIIPPVAEPA